MLKAGLIAQGCNLKEKKEIKSFVPLVKKNNNKE